MPRNTLQELLRRTKGSPSQGACSALDTDSELAVDRCAHADAHLQDPCWRRSRKHPAVLNATRPRGLLPRAGRQCSIAAQLAWPPALPAQNSNIPQDAMQARLARSVI